MAQRQRTLHAALIVTALALYQIEHGTPPVTLEDLVPTYFAILPFDPMNGRPYGYRISNGESITWQLGNGRYTLAPGQALLWTTENRDESEIRFPVPMWNWKK